VFFLSVSVDTGVDLLVGERQGMVLRERYIFFDRDVGKGIVVLFFFHKGCKRVGYLFFFILGYKNCVGKFGVGFFGVWLLRAIKWDFGIYLKRVLGFLFWVRFIVGYIIKIWDIIYRSYDGDTGR
jgi:hypothetical protein